MPRLGASERPSLFKAPLRCEFTLDAVLRCLYDTDRPFALVGAWAGGGAVLGCSPVRVARRDEDPFALLAGDPQDAGGSEAVGGGWVGYLGYELRAQTEPGHPAPPRTHPKPAFALAYYDHVLRRDASGQWWFEGLWTEKRAVALEARRAWWTERLADPPPERAASTDRWRLTPGRGAHSQLVAACRHRIAAGDLYQANVCAELGGRLRGSALELFIRGVEALTPDRAAYLDSPWGTIVSLSPELFIERHGRRVRTAPIKGTRRRSESEALARLERSELANSEKDRAENVMIVDLMRNDLGRICEPGSIVAEPLAQVRAHTGVWHMVSEVRGMLRPGVDDAELLRATFPPGSVTGAPKVAAMNVIAELESTAREVYTGAIGIASPLAGLELSVAIRTFEVSGATVRLGVGGGVVADSDPDAEAAELVVKAAPLLAALGTSIMPADPPRGRAPPVRRLGPIPIPRPDPLAGVFETVLVLDGRAVRLDSHLARVRASVIALYDAPLPDSTAELIEAAAATVNGDSRLRVDVRPGAVAALDVAVALGPFARAGAARLRIWTVPGGLGAHKWTDRRLIDALEAHSPGELPLFVDADGGVLEASRASVFALGRDGVLRTPPADGRILPGVARAHVLTQAPQLGLPALETSLVLDDLLDARGVMLTSALGHTPVFAIDGRRLDSGPGISELLRCAPQGPAAGPR